MSQVYINSSGNYNEYMDGELVNNSEYVANYDGDVLDLAVKNNDEEYFTQLGNDQLLKLLDNRFYSVERGSLGSQLRCEFPEKKTKSRSKKKSRKRSSNRRLTKRQKLQLIDSVFSEGNPHTPTI